MRQQILLDLFLKAQQPWRRVWEQLPQECRAEHKVSNSLLQKSKDWLLNGRSLSTNTKVWLFWKQIKSRHEVSHTALQTVPFPFPLQAPNLIKCFVQISATWT